MPGSDKSGCDHVACVFVSPLLCHSTDHSQLSHALPCNSTPVAVLQLTQIPPSSTDCLQISDNDDPPSPMSLTCNCSVYCTLPTSVCTLLQINIQQHRHYWHFISSWNQIGILHCHWIPMFVMVLPGPIITKHSESTMPHTIP